MKRRRITPVQGRGTHSKVVSPPHQLGIQLGGADPVAAPKKTKMKIKVATSDSRCSGSPSRRGVSNVTRRLPKVMRSKPKRKPAHHGVEHVRVKVKKDGSEEITVFGPEQLDQPLGSAPIPTAPDTVSGSGQKPGAMATGPSTGGGVLGGGTAQYSHINS